jgi:hypothetical protein
MELVLDRGMVKGMGVGAVLFLTIVNNFMNPLIEAFLINNFEDMGAGELMQKFNAAQGYTNGHGYGNGEGFGYGEGDGDGDGNGDGDGEGPVGGGQVSWWECGWGNGAVTGQGDGEGSGKG